MSIYGHEGGHAFNEDQREGHDPPPANAPEESEAPSSWQIGLEGIMTTTLFGARFARPLVNVEILPLTYATEEGAEHEPWPEHLPATLHFQMDAVDARNVGLNLLGAAFASEQDGIIAECLAQGGVDVASIAGLLRHAREIRDQLEASETPEALDAVFATFTERMREFMVLPPEERL